MYLAESESSPFRKKNETLLIFKVTMGKLNMIENKQFDVFWLCSTLVIREKDSHFPGKVWVWTWNLLLHKSCFTFNPLSPFTV